MFDYLNIKNLVETKKYQNSFSNIKGGMILTVNFKRNLIETTNYRFAGICISSRKRGIGSSIIVRNVISLYPLEYTFNIYSPLITIIGRKSENKITKSKLYYLRDKPAPLSKINFKYV